MMCSAAGSAEPTVTGSPNYHPSPGSVAEALIRAIHDSPTQAVVAVTGGGVASLTWLLTVPGASRTVLEGMVPYAASALTGLLGAVPDQAVSAATALAMARACRQRAAYLAGPGAGPLVGVGATAALVSDRPKKGDHRAFVGLCWNTEPNTESVWSLSLARGARDRHGEDALVSALVVAVLGHGCGVEPRGFPGAGAGDLFAGELFPGEQVEPCWPTLARRDPVEP